MAGLRQGVRGGLVSPGQTKHTVSAQAFSQARLRYKLHQPVLGPTLRPLFPTPHILKWPKGSYCPFCGPELEKLERY